ncbi:hypothetical protein [Bordetella hinzii]|uniref:hypothetical protein n=1 Tax=Bordetella hinzii TaxID=103855 RepID=UPI00115441E1|nr:hypothetical protein [Bordetella hinzii]QDJ52835.1 hypothetical protein CBR69_22195 [Bordetella hinzii]
MQTNFAALPDDATRVAPPGELQRDRGVRVLELSDDRVLDTTFNLFAGRTTQAFGETREWWAEALIDAGHDDLCRLALPALSAAARRVLPFRTLRPRGSRQLLTLEPT